MLQAVREKISSMVFPYYSVMIPPTTEERMQREEEQKKIETRIQEEAQKQTHWIPPENPPYRPEDQKPDDTEEQSPEKNRVYGTSTIDLMA